MIELCQLNKSYNNRPLIQDLSISIKKNQLTSLIGPNGAGKSTLLNMIGRLIDFDSGHIIIDGTQLNAWPHNDLAKKLAILKQSNPIQPQLSIRELLSFGRFPYSKGHLNKVDQLHIEKALAFLDLEDLQNKNLNQLSGGQLQRAYIGMILCQDTDYILLDEPLNNLDINHAVNMMTLIRRMVDEMGKTVLVVLHDINYASQFSDRIIAMKNGQLFANDSVDDVFQKNIMDELFDMDVEIIEHNLRKYCLYYGRSSRHSINNSKKLKEFEQKSKGYDLA